jgi:hypothetical protein
LDLIGDFCNGQFDWYSGMPRFFHSISQNVTSRLAVSI